MPGACAGGTRAAWLGSPSQVSGAHRLRRRCKDAAKCITLTRVLLTCFGIESQQSFPMFQQIYHACQLLIFRSGPCLCSCHFLSKKKCLPEDSETNANRVGFAVQVQVWWLVCRLHVQMHPDLSESLHMWDRIALCPQLRLHPAFRGVQYIGTKHANVIELARIQSQQITQQKLSEYFWKQEFFFSSPFPGEEMALLKIDIFIVI